MTLITKARNSLRGLVQAYGPKPAKRLLWNREFSTGKWDFLDKTGDRSMQSKIEKHADNGHILDLGCGSGTTGIDLNPDRYISYTGVDISDVAIKRAKSRARQSGRQERNQYLEADIFTYVPNQLCDLILFGDSIYYIPHSQIRGLLKRYSEYLANRGVFLVRIHDVSGKHKRILEIIEEEYQVVEKDLQTSVGATSCIIAFKPI